jgi:hypothetical protein
MVGVVVIPEGREEVIRVEEERVAIHLAGRVAKVERVVDFGISISPVVMALEAKCLRPKCFEARVGMTVKFPQRKERAGQT